MNQPIIFDPTAPVPIPHPNYFKMPTNFDREELIQGYITRVIDNMSTKDLVRIVWEQLEENLDSYTDDQLITEVDEFYPELLCEYVDSENEDEVFELTEDQIKFLRESVKKVDS